MKTRSRPKVSILLPVRNVAGTLEACLQSIRRQSFQNWECVVVDDGSRDGTARIVQSVARADGRFRPVESGALGLIRSLNLGLAYCQGEWIARMDGDDLMRRNRLSAQAAVLEAAPGYAGVGSHVRMFPRRSLGPGMRAYEEWLNRVRTPDQVRTEAWIECPLAHPSLMIRASTFKAAGYQDHGWPEDYDLVLRLLGKGERLGVLPRRLLAWRRREDGLSRTSPRYRRERFTACKANHLCRKSRIGFLAGVSRYLLWGYGGTGRALARALREHGRKPAGIVEVHPGRLGNRILDAPVIPPEKLPSPGGLPLVVSVAGAGPRERIRRYLQEGGWREGRDFICAA